MSRSAGSGGELELDSKRRPVNIAAFDRVADGVGARTMVGLGATPARSGDATALWVGNPPVIVSSTEMRLTDVEANSKLDRIQGWAEDHPEEGVTVIVGPPQDDCIPDSE